MHPATQPDHTGPDLSAAGPYAALVTAVGATAAALALAFIPPWEATPLVGYRDIGGVITACTGHTATAVLGKRYTPADCQALLASDLVKHAKDLDCIKTPQPLQPHEKAALLSVAFNVGPGRAGVKDGLCVLRDGRPTTIRTAASRGDMKAACASISEWAYSGGKDCRVAANKCSGIPRRRQAERDMCDGHWVGAAAAAASAAGVAP